MNILEYIEELMEQGYTEEEAEMCADFAFSEEPDYEDWESYIR